METEYWRVMTWPNVVTGGRLVLGIAAVLHIFSMIDFLSVQPFNILVRSGIGGDIIITWSTEFRTLFGGLLLTCAISLDGFDGWLARKYGWQSRFGEVLDPFVDKILFWLACVTIVWIQTLTTMEYFLIGTVPILLCIVIYDIVSLTKHFTEKGGATQAGKSKSLLLNLALLSCFIGIVVPDLFPQYQGNHHIMYGAFGIAGFLILMAFPKLVQSLAQRR